MRSHSSRKARRSRSWKSMARAMAAARCGFCALARAPALFGLTKEEYSRSALEPALVRVRVRVRVGVRVRVSCGFWAFARAPG